MKPWLWAAIGISLASLGGVAACSSDSGGGGSSDDDGDGDGDGAGGSGAAGGSTGTMPPTTTTGTTMTTGASMPTSTGTGMPLQSCDDIGTCEGDGMDPASGCIECSVLGDDTWVDGGTCQQAYIACFGTDMNCTGGDPECCALGECLNNCPMDDANTPNVNEELECVCGPNNYNEQGQCLDLMNPPPGGCFGDHVDGIPEYAGVVQCILVDTCPNSCQ